MKIECTDCLRTAHKRIPKGSTVLGLTMHMCCPECQSARDRRDYANAMAYKYTAVTPFGVFRANEWGALWLKVTVAEPKGRIEG